MTTQVYEKMAGESPEAWRLRAADGFGNLVEVFEDGKGDPERMVITTIRGERDGYQITMTLIRNDRCEAPSNKHGVDTAL